MAGAAKNAYLRSEDRRAATVESVLKLAEQLSPQQITTGQIAGEMGLTQGSLFRHFSSKDAIWTAVMDWVSDRLLGRVEAAAVETDGALAALEAIFDAHVRFVTEHPGVPRIILGELQNPQPSAARQVTMQMLNRYAIVVELQVKRGQIRGELRPELDSAVVARHFIGTIQGCVVQTLLGPRPLTLDEMAPAAFDLFRAAVQARTARETKE